jgi:ATP-dependent Clp protease adaptor protein ClpS
MSSSSSGSGGTKRKSNVQTKERTQRPRKFKVILHNDDYTPMEFVLLVLEHIFHISGAKASRIMMNAHQTGRGVVGSYSKEVAETKCLQSVQFARSNNLPLLLTNEPE